MAGKNITVKYLVEERVYIKGPARHGNVTAIMVERYGVSYKVIWWDEAVRHEEWVFDFEIGPAKDKVNEVTR